MFPPSKRQEHAKETSNVHHQWRPPPKTVDIRHRPPYNCRHTYATICVMSGLNPAFIAQQLGHSVQMLLSTYARWLNSSSDWSELENCRLVSNRYQTNPDRSTLLIGKTLDLHR